MRILSKVVVKVLFFSANGFGRQFVTIFWDPSEGFKTPLSMDSLGTNNYFRVNYQI